MVRAECDMAVLGKWVIVFASLVTFHLGISNLGGEKEAGYLDFLRWRHLCAIESGPSYSKVL